MGAGVIAVSPITPQAMPNLHLPTVHASAVQLAAQVNPIAQWGQVITEALANTKNLATEIFANPAPVLTQVLTNQLASAVLLGGSIRDFLVASGQQLAQTPEQLKTAFQQFAAGQISDGLQTLMGAVLAPIITPILTTTILGDVQTVIRKPVQNMLNVIDAALPSASGTGWFITAAFPSLIVLSDVVTATGDGLQNVVNALGARNLVAALGAIVAIPGSITGALLNGYNGDGAGILGPNGVVQGFRNALNIIATAIKPTVPAPNSAASIPSAGTTMVALSAGEATTLTAKRGAAEADKSSPEAAAPAATDNSAAGAPAAKQDRRTRGTKPSTSAEAGTEGGTAASTGDGVKGADEGSATATGKGTTNSKRDRSKPNGGDTAASDSGSNSGRSHESAGKSRGAGKGGQRAAKAGGD
ncbi:MULTISPECIES: hypothetical protein [unclassified Mycolicibacterium]|nr:MULTISPECIES: hypothetical protein [unclassified Mycolicibacterium]MUL69489.1 hypothetical protein [Mycolicibacterium sp. CBMA 311]MUL94453.1 hypothetical protein [Mycolicibacterium sp. CBMA 230]MUM06530.1 hypothetical protein [Mycolicibacterium sp. CBMA 213]